MVEKHQMLKKSGFKALASMVRVTKWSRAWFSISQMGFLRLKSCKLLLINLARAISHQFKNTRITNWLTRVESFWWELTLLSSACNDALVSYQILPSYQRQCYLYSELYATNCRWFTWKAGACKGATRRPSTWGRRRRCPLTTARGPSSQSRERWEGRRGRSGLPSWWPCCRRRSSTASEGRSWSCPEKS